MIYKEEKDISLPRPHKYSCFWGKNHYLILRKCEKICLNPYPPPPQRGGGMEKLEPLLKYVIFFQCGYEFLYAIIETTWF